MPSTPIPIQSITALRITCQCCGVALVLPPSVREVPHICFNCDNHFPADLIKDFMRTLGRLQRSMAEPDARSQVAVEVLGAD